MNRLNGKAELILWWMEFDTEFLTNLWFSLQKKCVCYGTLQHLWKHVSFWISWDFSTYVLVVNTFPMRVREWIRIFCRILERVLLKCAKLQILFVLTVVHYTPFILNFDVCRRFTGLGNYSSVAWFLVDFQKVLQILWHFFHKSHYLCVFRFIIYPSKIVECHSCFRRRWFDLVTFALQFCDGYFLTFSFRLIFSVTFARDFHFSSFFLAFSLHISSYILSWRDSPGHYLNLQIQSFRCEACVHHFLSLLLWFPAEILWEQILLRF